VIASLATVGLLLRVESEDLGVAAGVIDLGCVQQAGERLVRVRQTLVDLVAGKVLSARFAIKVSSARDEFPIEWLPLDPLHIP
jgi:hypothetical protein